MHQAADAYLALDALSRDPRIDRDRIAMIGLSAGGNAALLASSETLRRRYVGEAGPRFAALVSIYPGGYALPAGQDVSLRTPILILPAENDDLMPWSRTKNWVDHVLRTAPSAPLSYKVVAGATHAFFNTNVRSSPDVPGAGTCPYNLLDLQARQAAFLHVGGTVKNAVLPGCASRGATMQHSRAAVAFALDETIVFMKKSFAASTGR